jgi:hypothetical protein
VVGSVRQVDFGVHPYPPHLLPRGRQYARSGWPRPRRSGVVTRVRWSLVRDLSQSRGTDPVPKRPLGRGRKPGFLRPGGRSGSWAQTVWTKLQPTRTVIRSRRGFGLGRMLVESRPAGDPGSLDLSQGYMES